MEFRIVWTGSSDCIGFLTPPLRGFEVFFGRVPSVEALG
jgi:hypothetical protein